MAKNSKWNKNQRPNGEGKSVGAYNGRRQEHFSHNPNKRPRSRSPPEGPGGKRLNHIKNGK
ncbi:hypothetical protein CANCADRAFT_31625, partial [Tortispora caseinolytica NRRL Y-17796]